ncbi:MAG: VWA domain-containing protein [Candidatus Omnitrophica bacterium]|nr:VWA domain-containing protein [Candidatus Omnitrophota bacterium]
MRRRSRDLIAFFILFSMLVHSGALLTSRFIYFWGMNANSDKKGDLFRLKDVVKDAGPGDSEVPGDGGGEPFPQQIKERDVREELRELDKMMEEDKQDEDVPIENKKDDLKKEDVKEKRADRTADEETLLQEEKALEKDAEPEKRIIEKTATDKTISKTSSVNSDDSAQVMEHAVEKKAYKWVVPVTGMMNVLKGGMSGGSGPDSGFFGGKTRIKEYDDITGLIDIKVLKYTNPSSGEKYFKLIIKIDKPGRLRVIPKEVIFLIDSSKSITETKLEYMKEGVINSLWKMNPGDKFNVIAFRSGLLKFMPEPVEISNANLLGAEMFIKSLEAVGVTDVNRSLLDMVNTALDRDPSYILLLTDGRPTTGVVDSKSIIRELTLQNKLDRPIFSFGGGDRVNRYLLDFISYQNRGWSRFAERAFNIRGDFVKLYEEIDNPLLLNLRYRLSNLDSKEVYPKYLPDFFAGRELTIYGHYNDANEFSMQLLGDIAGETKEMIFKRALAEADEGDASIERDWAFRKIYYLISQDTQGKLDSEKAIKEVKALSARYKIVTPYDIEKGD